MIPETDFINHLQASELERLIQLDCQGLIMGCDESLEQYQQRLLAMSDKLRQIEHELSETQSFAPFDDLQFKASDTIPAEIIAEAAEITRKLYGFSIDWVPGFFMSTNLGLLWGGCAISVPEEHFSLFLIRKSFRHKKRWFIYRRDELLAHELCHIARAPMHDFKFEEHFAYQTAFSRLRRYMGNCFIHAYDAILFVMPIMILLTTQIMISANIIHIPIWPFWIAALSYPIWLLIRNQLTRNMIHRAMKNLSDIATNPGAVLFRCSGTEIAEYAKAQNHTATEQLWQDKTSRELRWQIIDRRFNRQYLNEQPATASVIPNQSDDSNPETAGQLNS